MRKIIFLLIISLQILLLNISQFVAWPEMLYEPYLINNGFIIYKNITIAHAPLLLFLLQVFFKIFANPVLAIKSFTLFLTIFTGWLTYFVCLRIFKKEKAAIVTWIFYIFLHFYFEGNGIWFDHLVALFSLVSFYFFYKFLLTPGVNKKTPGVYVFSSGLFLGLASISKQTAGWLIIPAFLYLLYHLLREKKLFKTIKFGLIFSIGCLIPWILVAGWLVYKNALADFWFWAFKFGINVLPKAAGQIKLPTVKQLIGASLPFLIIIPYSSQACRIFSGLACKKQVLEKKILIVLWCIFSAFGVYPRFERFHFQPALPLLAMIWVSSFFSKKNRVYAFLLFLIFVPFWLRSFSNTFNKPDRFLEGDVQAAVSWLVENTKKDQRIYVFNTWDHFYALADRLPAVDPVPPTLEWYLELPGLQEKLISGLKKVKSPIIIMEDYKKEGLGAYRPERLDNYIRESFTQKTVITERFIILEKK